MFNIEQVWEQWSTALQHESKKFRSNWLRTKSQGLPIDEMHQWWESAWNDINQIIHANDIEPTLQSWLRWLMSWKTAMTLTHEWVLIYEESREKVAFADLFGLYYRSQSMIEADAMIHPLRWVNRFSAIRTPEQIFPYREFHSQMEELLRLICMIWKSPIPEQQWVSAYFIWSLRHQTPLQSMLEQTISKSATPWLSDLVDAADHQVRQQFQKLSPLIRARNTALVMFLFRQEKNLAKQRIGAWLEWATGYIGYLPTADADHIWTWREMWASEHRLEEPQIERDLIKLLLTHLPSTKSRLVRYATEQHLPKLRLEVELLTEGDPMTWSTDEWQHWCENYPAEIVPLLHHRLEQIMKWKASERESAMEWIWTSLQSIYTQLNREEEWKLFIQTFDLRFGRTRVGRSLREKEGSL